MEKLYYYVFSVFIVHVYAVCIDEHLPHGSAVVTTGRYYSIHYECDDGYEMFGPADSYCFNGHWATPVPVCHSKGCSRDEYQTVANGKITVISQDSLIIVTCNPGFIMDGENIISCDGVHWSEPLPNCYSAIDINQCDFEHKSFCGWTQDSDNYPDWEINSGNTSTTRTGPSYDHTYGHSIINGHYIYMESSIPRQYGHISRLVSPVYPRQKSRRCFELWYHMLGPEEPEYMGDLEIILRIQNENEYIEKELFFISGNQGDEWHEAVVFIELQDTDFQIVVQATRGRSHTSDIAVDDFSFYKCTNDSDFEDDIWATDSTVLTTSNSNAENKTSDNGNYTTISNTTTEGLKDASLQQKSSQNEAYFDNLAISKSNTAAEHILSSSSIPKSHSVEPTIASSTVETMTLPRSSEFQSIIKKDETTDYVRISEQTTTVTVDVHIGTENVIFYPVDIEHPSENMASRNEPNNLDKAAGTTSAAINRHPEGENLLFNPVFISVISGLCAAIVIAVVIVSVLVHRRRHIWGRKTSDDQVEVLYLKNTQPKEASQNV